jgi:hypothetical protein
VSKPGRKNSRIEAFIHMTSIGYCHSNLGLRVKLDLVKNRLMICRSYFAKTRCVFGLHESEISGHHLGCTNGVGVRPFDP